MSNPKGNPGNKGGGRKSAYQELADAKTLWKKWTDPELADAVLAKIAGGKASLEDIFFALGHKEDTKVLVEIFKKIYPDISKTDIMSGGKPIALLGGDSNGHKKNNRN